MMRWRCDSFRLLGSRVRCFFRDYDNLQALAIVLIYIQIGCALIGSLGALFNGVLLINLVIGLFALVAIESGSQKLGRTYAMLLFIAILLDFAWFILFSHTIWNITPDEKFGALVIFSLRLTFFMQIFGFSIRFLSSFVWFQMYRLGASSSSFNPHLADTDLDARSSFLSRTDHDARNSFLSRTDHDARNRSGSSVRRQNSLSDEILGGSIYDPAYYSSLFKDPRDNGCILEQEGKEIRSDGESTSTNESFQAKSSTIDRYFHKIDVDPALMQPLNQ